MRTLAPFSYPQLYACRSPPHPPIEGAPHGSQSHEDEWLWSTVFAGLPPEEQVNGFFVELGALDGTTYSNSLWFEKALNWRGLLIEGHPDNSPLLAQAQRTVRTSAAAFGNSICPFAADGAPGTLSFTSGGSATGAATEAAAEGFLRAHHGGQAQGPKRVDCVPMQALLDATGVLDIDVLSLDVEGAEHLVLQTIDFAVTNIRVIVIELDGHDKEKDERCRALLRAAGFVATPTSPRSACRPGEDCTSNDAFIQPGFAARKAARRQPLTYVPGTGTRCA
jgi:FkbM family methyltransferase